MYSGEEYAAALDEAAYEALDAAGIDRPPVDALHVAQRLGMVVACDRRQNARARLVRLARRDQSTRSAILLRAEPRSERRQFAVAHEIGEHLSAGLFSRLNVDPCQLAPPLREGAANHLAGRLLLPTDWLAVAALACDWDLVRLKQQFNTASHELIARRMLDFSTPVVITVLDQGAQSWRSSNVWGALPLWSDDERCCWRQAHESGQQSECSERSGRVRAWAIHEPQWKREIVRFEPNRMDVDDDPLVDSLLPTEQWTVV
ncbi:MAG: ImmA/IrrE family metallo-endopeptidase [Pirellulales bacterium]|nr:ImmA/IrrE family metallo-endopeptidase [Pirellulales bacterium]